MGQTGAPQLIQQAMQGENPLGGLTTMFNLSNFTPLIDIVRGDAEIDENNDVLNNFLENANPHTRNQLVQIMATISGQPDIDSFIETHLNSDLGQDALNAYINSLQENPETIVNMVRNMDATQIDTILAQNEGLRNVVMQTAAGEIANANVSDMFSFFEISPQGLNAQILNTQINQLDISALDNTQTLRLLANLPEEQFRNIVGQINNELPGDISIDIPAAALDYNARLALLENGIGAVSQELSQNIGNLTVDQVLAQFSGTDQTPPLDPTGLPTEFMTTNLDGIDFQNMDQAQLFQIVSSLPHDQFFEQNGAIAQINDLLDRGWFNGAPVQTPDAPTTPEQRLALLNEAYDSCAFFEKSGVLNAMRDGVQTHFETAIRRFTQNPADVQDQVIDAIQINAQNQIGTLFASAQQNVEINGEFIHAYLQEEQNQATFARLIADEENFDAIRRSITPEFLMQNREIVMDEIFPELTRHGLLQMRELMDSQPFFGQVFTMIFDFIGQLTGFFGGFLPENTRGDAELDPDADNENTAPSGEDASADQTNGQDAPEDEELLVAATPKPSAPMA